MILPWESVAPVRAESIVLRYYISSAKLTAKELLAATRVHCSIENQLYWCLDIGMREDNVKLFGVKRGKSRRMSTHSHELTDSGQNI